MSLDYKLLKENNFDAKGLKEFILNVNNDFPIPITDKINIDEFLDKIRKKGVVCCAYDDKKIVSGAFFYANNFLEKTVGFTLLATLKDYRKYGLGSKLINMMIDYCIKLGFEKIQLYTHETNVRAIEYYLKKGFYYIDCDREHHVKLEKKII